MNVYLDTKIMLNVIYCVKKNIKITKYTKKNMCISYDTYV